MQKEKRKHWAEREKRLQQVTTSGMYGALQAIIGTALQPVAALELDRGLLEHQGDE